MTKANAAIHYTPDNYSTSGPKLMGKGSANENFLRAFMRYADVDDQYCFTKSRQGFDAFAATASQISEETKRAKTQRWVSVDRQNQFAEPGCLYVPAPQIAQYAWTRRQFDQRSYSLCGLTHTISSQGVMKFFEDTVIAPTQEWDAIICTSEVVRKSINNVMDEYTEYMRGRFGGPKFELKLQLPVIPLGVDCSAYTATNQRKARAATLRAKLSIAEDDIVFLFVGRLSMHAKAHPTPMYLALEQAAQRSGKKIHLLQSGWFDNDGQKNAFLQGANVMCPSVNHHVVDGRSLEVRDCIYHACDIFTSLSDNIQETFGLTPLEAMAAGKPVVVTDWNGYRDTVRNGVDGITVPTLAPAPGASFDLGKRFETEEDNYDRYIGGACQVTSVDIAKCADAYTALVNDANLRKTMGDAGQKRAEESYDWKHIIGRYQYLWAELANIRTSGATESAKRKSDQPSNPLYSDPFSVFDSYPTAAIKPDDIIALAENATEQRFLELYKLPINNFCMHINENEFVNLFRTIEQNNTKTVAEITALLPEENRDTVARYLIWFAKVGLVAIGAHNISNQETRQKLAG
jgi:starch synthase